KEGVGRSGEVDARDRHTRKRWVNRDDGLIDLKITILVIDQGRPIGTDVGAAVRPGENRLRVQAPRVVAPVKTVVAKRLRAPVDKGDATATDRRRRAVTG